MGAGRGLGSAAPSVGAGAGRGSAPGPARQNARTRSLTTAATRHTRAGMDEDIVALEGAWEEDDAPPDDDVVELGSDGGADEPGDEQVTNEETEDPWPRSRGWAQVSFWDAPEGLSFAVNVPRSTDPQVAVALTFQERAWQSLAAVLIQRQPRALRATTPADAYHALARTPMRELETSIGQGSRDRDVLVETPAGLLPLWFFACKHESPELVKDLIVLADHLTAHPEVDRLTASEITTALPSPSIKPDSLRKSHGPTLVALRSLPDVLAAHRSLWPHTHWSLLQADLGMSGRRCSVPVSVLALVGLIFSGPTAPPTVPLGRPPRRQS